MIGRPHEDAVAVEEREEAVRGRENLPWLQRQRKNAAEPHPARDIEVRGEERGNVGREREQVRADDCAKVEQRGAEREQEDREPHLAVPGVFEHSIEDIPLVPDRHSPGLLQRSSAENTDHSPLRGI